MSKYSKIIKGGALNYQELVVAIELDNIAIKLNQLINHISEKINDKYQNYSEYRPEMNDLHTSLRKVQLKYSAQIFPMMLKKEITLQKTNPTKRVDPETAGKKLKSIMNMS